MTVRAILAIRLLGLALFILGTWLLVANLFETIRQFDPTYAWYYFQNQLLRPVLAMGLGCILLLFSKPLGKFMARELEQK
ncbi:MAG: hypothetical protein SFY80_08525 [Verrucomicrobiota bacterium]|nr:hypothetical protein [Verrucomicrobiota bacterium]